MKAKAAEKSAIWIGGGILLFYALSKLNLPNKLGSSLGDIVGGGLSGFGATLGNMIGGAATGLEKGSWGVITGVGRGIDVPIVNAIFGNNTGTRDYNEGSNAFKEYGVVDTLHMAVIGSVDKSWLVNKLNPSAAPNKASLDAGVAHVAANGGVGGAAYAYYYPYYMNKHWLSSYEFNALVQKAQGNIYTDSFVVSGDAALSKHGIKEFTA